ncbi:MAG: LytTR family DNA-binding domain-containing protein [Bacteroidia bacterium]|nr:LytTR family DNA-binding domain-containing protein [Bacteroidia bacterium]
MVIKVCLVDDEPLAREIIESYIQKMPQLELVQTCENAVQAIKVLDENRVDLLFLDINLPDINGMSLVKQLRVAPAIIFTTAYPQYALESYDMQAVDYLLKPFSAERFEMAVQKYVRLRASEQVLVQPEEAERPLFLRSEGKWVKVNLADIIWVEALKDYVKICLKNNQRLTMHGTMKNMEQKLSEQAQFCRVHKSYIINLKHIEQVESNLLRMEGKEFPIGATYKDDLLKKIAEFSIQK